MQLKRNGNGNGKKNGHAGNGNRTHSVLKIVVLAIAVILVAVLAWRQFQRWRGPTATVWVASTELDAGSRLGSDGIEQDRRRMSDLPPGAVSGDQPIAGRELARAKRQGDPIVAGDLARDIPPADAPSPGMSEMLPEGRVMMRVPIAVENVLMHELRRGDRLDVLGVDDAGRARVIASDVYMLAYVDPNLLRRQSEEAAAQPASGEGERRRGLLESLISSSTAAPQRGRGPIVTSRTNVLVALHPKDVLAVATVAAEGPLTIALHGRKEVRDGELLSIDSEAWGVEYITGASRGAVEFVQ